MQIRLVSFLGMKPIVSSGGVAVGGRGGVEGTGVAGKTANQNHAGANPFLASVRFNGHYGICAHGWHGC